jgi:hypothetical protein
MIHKHRHVHELELGQEAQQRFSDVEDTHLAPAADVQPFFCNLRHVHELLSL